MSQYTSLIPPDVSPPEPPGTKTVSWFISAAMTVVMLALIIFICVDFFADMVNIPMPQDAVLEQTIREECGPFISDFLELNFPGQYAMKYGKNSRFENYSLTDEDQKNAILKLQYALQSTESFSLEIIENVNQQPVNEIYYLHYDNNLAAELCTQLESAQKTSISPLDSLRIPDLVFTLYPSKVRINLKNTSSVISVYITLDKGMQRWEGFFGSGIVPALFNARLLSGQSVRECISERMPDFPVEDMTER